MLVRPARFCLVALVLALGAVAPSIAGAAVPSTSTAPYGTDGEVDGITTLGSTIYLGGSFSHVGLATAGAPVSAANGTANAATPVVSGNQPSVNAAISDGSGGFYIGGSFSHVGGVARHDIAHILADGSVDPSFNPNASGGIQNEVDALALSGSTLYVGGLFNSIGGLTRHNIAALDTSSGNATSWNPNADRIVLTLCVSGSTVYAGGDFTTIGGQTRNHIAALDANTDTNNATNWDPNADTGVRVLAVSGSTVYAGGDFHSIGGQPRTRIAALNANIDTNNATNWDPNANGPVLALAVSGSTVYAGGFFTTIGGTARNYIAALNANTNTNNATGWNPNPNNLVHALAVSGSTVYAGGEFSSIAGQTRNRAATLDATSGNATGFDPNAGGGDTGVHALAPSGSTVYVGGSFSIINDVARNNLAAIDATTGQPTSWNPDANAPVDALAASGSTVYASGLFNTVGGQTRNQIAALDPTTGAPTSWDPEADGEVDALALSGSTLYVGGGFTTIGAAARNNIAALDTSSGNATSFNPNADGCVCALAVAGSTVYAGGSFTTAGGQPRNNIAALNASTGSATSWNPDALTLGDGPTPAVYALAVSGSTVYAGGLFNSIGGQTHNNIAALDASSGSATSWNPNADGEVDALAVSGSTVYAGGLFSTIGGANRNNIAALDGSSGSATSFDPGSSGEVFALALAPSALYAGGSFASMDSGPSSNFAAFVETPANTGLPSIKNASSPSVGTKLSTNAGTWTATPTRYKVQWLRCDADGTSNCGAVTPYRVGVGTYVPQAADAGHTLRASYIASTYFALDSAPATSAPSGVVAQPVPTNTSPPSIKNGASPAVGTKLSTEAGGWTGSPTSYKVQWVRCDADGVSNCTSATPYRVGVGTYVPVAADAGHTLRVNYIATNAGGDSNPATSAASGVVSQAVPTNTSPPRINNATSPAVGTKLTTEAGSWTGSPTSYKVQWLHCDADGVSNCVAVTAYRMGVGTYTPQSADSGHTLRVNFIATNAAGDSAPATSVASGVVSGGGGSRVRSSPPRATRKPALHSRHARACLRGARHSRRSCRRGPGRRDSSVASRREGSAVIVPGRG
jgi:hypothetical protein